MWHIGGYFSSGAEGLLILVAAKRSSEPHGRCPRALGSLGWVGCLHAAAMLNLVVAQTSSTGKAKLHRSEPMQHLMTDVWTSVGVIAGIGSWH
jgi:hypothetical protein